MTPVLLGATGALSLLVGYEAGVYGVIPGPAPVLRDWNFSLIDESLL